MSEGVRIALVGCGAIGELVARRVYASPPPGARVVAVVDRVAHRAAEVGALLGVPAFTDLAEVPAVDAVDIRLPHDAHAAAVLHALDAGLHVLVEKPLATTEADGRALVEAAGASDRVVAVAENYPHLATVQAAARAIEAGRIGELVAVRTTRAYRLDGVWLRDGWRQDGGPAAGILLDQGTHHTSLLRHLAGPIAAVTASGGADTVGLTLRFASGVIGQSLYTWVTPAFGPEIEATAYGTGGRIDIRVDYEGTGGSAVLRSGEVLVEGEDYYDSHRAIVADWVGAIREGRTPLVDAASAFADLRVVLAAAEEVDRWTL
ncbi:Gfo/Idh/MocA family oxidoreductase [Actinoplanes sp. NPDC089786]|uniref:Gfo/Idh/MocA family protein n=1 Tax=Actinoplanes sp. NPDC089786 TaxID=3155185 RepID=UPI00343C8669